MNGTLMIRRKGKRSPYAIGRRGQDRYAEMLQKNLQSYGYTVWNNPVNKEGVDIVVFDKNGNPILIYEVTNYNRKSFMSSKRAKRYIDSLNREAREHIGAKKHVVVSYPENVDKIRGIRDLFRKNNVEIIELGFQD